VALDRADALKKAEKFLRQGKLDSAIQEYVRLIEEYPRDWNAINALGDLYVRAADTERAVAQFARVADHLFDEGFLPKASALYKKALKVQPRHEHTLSRLAEIATRQGLLADAAMYLRQLLDQRRTRGDEPGVAEVMARLRDLDEDGLEPSGRREPAAPPPVVAPPAPVAPEPPPDDPQKLFELARTQLYAGEDMVGRAVLTRVLTLDPVRHAEALQLALDLVAAGRIDTAFGCVDVITDAALLEGDLQRAIEALQTFVDVAPHLPASIKLVDLCVDAGLEDDLRAAQAQLADAYLVQGSGAEARIIAEDLLEQDPTSELHAERLRRALGLLQIADTEGVIAEIRGRREVPLIEDFESETPARDEPAAAIESTEIDLSDALSGIETTTTPAAHGDPAVILERALDHMQAGRVEEALADLQAAAAQPRTRARAAAELGRLYNARGDLHAAVQWFELAADGPAPSQDEAYAVLYDLADALARLGEPARALAILIDLDAEAGEYRDVRIRIEQLAGSRGQ
jgi:tetratricopeptide (TPR) repeat protein